MAFPSDVHHFWFNSLFCLLCTKDRSLQELAKYFRKCEPPALSFGADAPAHPAPPAPQPAPQPAPGTAQPVLRREMTPQVMVPGATAPAALVAPAVAPAVAAPVAPVYYPNYGPGYGLGIGTQPAVAVPYAQAGAGVKAWRAPA